jgi:phosphonate transport system substrate-binding protein
MLAAAFAGGAASAAPASAAHDELVLGRVSDNPKGDYARLKPLLDYIVPRMADVGIRRGRVLMARDNQQMISYLRRGKVDWVSETAGSGMSYQERANAHVLLVAERSGMREYQSVFFTRRDSGIEDLSDLRGKRVAFQNPASTSAYFLPATEMMSSGLPLMILISPEDRPASNSVGFVFARSELNISTWVHKGLVDAGAFGEQDWRDLERLPESFRNDLVVFHRSSSVPRALELVRGGLTAPVEARLRELLMAAPADPLATDALRAYWNTTAFATLDARMQQSLAGLRNGVQRLRLEVE